MVPDFQSFFLPLLKFSADGKAHTMKEARAYLAAQMDMSEEDLKERLPSGKETTFSNRVSWEKSFFVQAGVLESPSRGVFHITKIGARLI